MHYDDYGAYFVPRKKSTRNKKRKRGSYRAAVLVTTLLLLTAAICLLVVFLPRFSSAPASSAHSFGGKTYYALATDKPTTRQAALAAAEHARERGGAGYIYNDGEYKIIAALYEREVDAKTLVSVNPDSFYFSLSVPSCDCADSDKAALEYLTGEWFASVNTAATELDRGNITEAAAELALSSACGKLRGKTTSVENSALKSALISVCDGEITGISVLAALRFIQASAIITVADALFYRQRIPIVNFVFCRKTLDFSL